MKKMFYAFQFLVYLSAFKLRPPTYCIVIEIVLFWDKI